MAINGAVPFSEHPVLRPVALDDLPDDEQVDDAKIHAALDSEHSENLADKVEPDALDDIGEELIAAFKADMDSSEEWFENIAQGLKLLGTKIEEVDEPFPGACAAHHPLMLEAAIQFQSRAIAELFPSNGPVKTKILGATSHEVVRQAERVREFMNYQITEVMEEYFDDLDAMLLMLPITGSCFKKVYYDVSLGRPVSKFIPADDFITSYTNSDLRTAGRYTQIIRILPNELRKLEVAGFYREADLGDPSEEDKANTTVKEVIDRIEGRSPSPRVDEARHLLLEMHVDYDLPGFEDKDEDGKETGIALPYVVTLDHDSHEILAIRRNWEENDPLRRRLQWFVHYRWLPNFGFYGLGLISLLGNLQKTATAAMRNLVDAAQFATLPAGFKQRGARMGGEDSPLKFGEFRDVDGGGDDLRKALIPLPTKEPSQTLFALLGMVVEDGRRLASITDINVGDSKDESPVGTTLALLEQGVRVMTAIHKRCHKAQREEFKLLARINAEYLPDVYPYDVEGATREIKKHDFNKRIDVLPVSDPNIFSETQRIMRAQTMLQLATQFPQQHQLHEALFRMHEVIGTQKIDDILVPDIGPKPQDPVTEEFSIMHSRPVMAYAWQDHAAHLQSHQAFMQNPQLGANPQLAQMLGPQMLAHIADHEAHQYRQQIAAATGIKLPPPPHFDPANPNKGDGYQPLPPQLENMVALASGRAAQQISQNAQMAATAQKNQQMMQDPLVQVEFGKLKVDQFEAQTKRMDVMGKHAGDAQKQQAQLQIEQQKAAMQLANDRQRAQLDAERKQLETRLKLVDSAIQMQQRGKEAQQKMATDQASNMLSIHGEATAAEAERQMAEDRHQQEQEHSRQRFAMEQDHAEKMAAIQRKAAAAKPKPAAKANGK